MPERSIVERVATLEQRVDLLETLPARLDAIEAQLLQHRREMNERFLAVRGEIRALEGGRSAEMHALHHLTIERIDASKAATRRYMRVMVEELITRIETIGEGRRARKKRQARPQAPGEGTREGLAVSL